MSIQNGMIDYEEFFNKLKSVMLSNEEIFNKNFENLLNCMRPKMQWKETFQPGVKYRYACSNCGHDENLRTPFCPQCGAKEDYNE